VNTFAPALETAILVIGHETGESMLNPHFFEIVRTIKDHKCRFTFNTTGLLLSPDRSRELTRLGVEELVFSIDSIREKTYQYLHVGGRLEKVMSNLESLAEHKRRVGSLTPQMAWYFVASRSNFEELPQIVSKAADLGFSSIYVAQLNEPVDGQYDSYFRFFDQENLATDERDRARLGDVLALGANLARERGLSFRVGA